MAELVDFIRLRAELLAALVTAVRSDVPEGIKDDLAIALGQLAEARRHARDGSAEVRQAEAVLRMWRRFLDASIERHAHKVP